MDRLNPAGVRWDDLVLTLRDRRLVMDARRIDACLLCRNARVNDAGLCIVCYSAIDGEALRLASRWLAGIGP